MPRRSRVSLLLTLLLTAALSCSLPGLAPPSSPPPPTATVSKAAAVDNAAAPPPLPPRLLSTEPAAGERISPAGSLVFHFDQPMDQASVEAGFQIAPAIDGSFEWLDQRTLRFSPNAPLPLDSRYSVSIDPLKGANGLTAESAASASFQTVPGLEITQVQPAPSASQVSTTADIRIAFNQPVVPLDLSEAAVQPVSFDPPVAGSGEWVGTSLYVFHPSPAIPAGRSIRASVDPSLTTVNGAGLNEPFEWSFTTGTPHLVQSDPSDGQSGVDLEPEITLTFNQPVMKASFEQNLSVTDREGQPIDGTIEWRDEENQAVFTPAGRLDYATQYLVNFAGTTGPAGAPLDGPLSYSFVTTSGPAVVSTFPRSNGTLDVYSSAYLQFTAPMDQASLVRNLAVEPQVENFGSSWNGEDRRLFVHGSFRAGQQYRVSLAAATEDAYGTSLGEPFSFQFRVGDYPPRVEFTRYNDVLTFSSGRPTEVELQARNISRIDLELYRLPLDSFLSDSQNHYYFLVSADQPGERIRSWSVSVPAQPNVDQSLRIPLGEDGPLPSGIYVLRMDSPEDIPTARGRFVVVRGTELVIKESADETLVWASDLESGQPLSDFTVQMVGTNGTELVEPAHGQSGIAHMATPEGLDPYDPLYVIHGQPGDPDFGITGRTWDNGIEPYQFGVPSRVRVPDQQDYLYTDRPLYRAGQTVYFRGVARSRQHDQYALPAESSIEVTVADPRGETLESLELPLSSFGTYAGSFDLPAEASLGSYQVRSEWGGVNFKVAAYRKPSFSIEVQPSHQDRIEGEPLSATITAEYFFGGPVADQEVSWQAYGSVYYPPDLPIGVRYGLAGPTTSGAYLGEGTGVTDANGQLTVEVPTTLDQPRPLDLTIEASISQSGDFPVSGRASVRLHPAALYLSLVPEEYSYQVGSTSLIRLHAADIHGEPLPDQAATVNTYRVTWRQVVDEGGSIRWQSEETPVNQDQLKTTDDGSVLFSFVPNRAGTYRIEAEATDAGGRTASGSTTVWVIGEAGGIWRQASADTITLVPDRSSYQPGQTAQVLVPSPFDHPATALVTVERESILSYQLLEIPPEGRLIPFDLDSTDSPNVYVSVTLLKPAGEDGPAAIASGLANLPVSAEAERLRVELTPDRDQARPGERVTYHLRAIDAAGDPVRAEFSLAMVDAALLSLAEPNSSPPFEALWGERPLAVRTAASLAISGEQHMELDESGGRGGGGGDAETNQVRQDFKDTAYWTPSVVTDEDGRADVEIQLPDNLTTWQTEVRGITSDTRAGSATDRLLVTKPLLIEPVTPRFFTANDRAQVAGVVHNNTQQDLSVQVSLLASGATIVQSDQSTVTVAAGDSERVVWDLSVGQEDGVGLTFTAKGGGFQDSSQPTIGSTTDGLLPVLRYSAPGTAATSGWLPEGGSQTESISTPTQLDSSQGELALSLEPGVGSLILQGLRAIEASPFETNETTASLLIAQSQAMRLLDNVKLTGGPSPAELSRQMQQNVHSLTDRQSNAGGWGWWPHSNDNTFLTAYVTHALLAAQAGGSEVDPRTLSSAVNVLRATLVSPAALDSQGLAEQAYVLKVLAEADAIDPGSFSVLAGNPDRMLTSGLASVVETLSRLSPNDESLPALTAELESRAVLSATGTHWDAQASSYRSFDSAISATADSARALLATEPASPSIQGAVRWLASTRVRDGGWPSSYQSAQAVEALGDWAAYSNAWAASFDYSARLNGQTQAEGRFPAGELTSAVKVSIPINSLATDRPNALTIERGPGDGGLAYSARLTAYQPAELVPASNHGLAIERRYYHDDGRCDFDENPCQPAEAIAAGDDLLVRLTLVTPVDAYRIAALDRYPAGAEPIDPGLQTSAFRPQLSMPRFDFGWLGWYFDQAEIGDDQLYLFADYLPAGTYTYVYRLHVSFAGTYRVMPARAWLVYFPEVYGQTAGESLTIGPSGQR